MCLARGTPLHPSAHERSFSSGCLQPDDEERNQAQEMESTYEPAVRAERENRRE
jgi:hypothetical protein